MVLSQVVSSPTTGNTIAGTVGGSLLMNAFGWLPLITGGVAVIGGTLGIIWYSIQIWESHTARSWRKRFTSRRRLRRVARLKNELKLFTAELSELAEHSPADRIALDEIHEVVRRHRPEPPHSFEGGGSETG